MMSAKLIYYPDTSYIYGRFKKKAKELKNRANKRKKQKTIKVDDKSEGADFKFILSQVTEMEIKKSLMNEEGLTFAQANKCFNDVLKEMPNYGKTVETIELTPDVCNTYCKSHIDLGDIFHILIAARLKLYIVTKEKKKLKEWKKVYPNVLSEEEFQKKIKT